MLICPMLDDRAITPSSTELVGEGVWDSISNYTGWSALLGATGGGPDVSPYAAPARATDLSGLPTAFVDAGSVETFRDESVDYASRIWQAGGQAELHIWPGGCHNFDGTAPHAPMSREARATRVNWLRRVLTPSR
jgi:acetyl esterase/lipase